MSATNNKIADLLAEHRRLRVAAKENRSEMLRVAVEIVGLGQQEALQMNLETFLDGYLIGQGVSQWRRGANVKEAA